MEMLPAAQPKSQFTPDHIGRSLLLCARGTHVAVGSRRGEKKQRQAPAQRDRPPPTKMTLKIIYTSRLLQLLLEGHLQAVQLTTVSQTLITHTLTYARKHTHTHTCPAAGIQHHGCRSPNSRNTAQGHRTKSRVITILTSASA